MMEQLVGVVDLGTSHLGEITANFDCIASYHAVMLALGSGKEGMVTWCLN